MTSTSMQTISTVHTSPSSTAQAPPAASRQLWTFPRILHSLCYRLARVTGAARLMNRLRPWVIRTAARSRWLSSLYYLLFSRAFGREHQAMLSGIERYHTDLARPAAGSALLRRNCHRLEKGLLMVPRRDVFAVEYIEETVKVFGSIAEGCTADASSELLWARDVLETYFDATASHPTIDAARERFRQVRKLSNGEPVKLVPYHRDLGEEFPVRLGDLARLAKRRRSVRWFLNRSVPREMIDAAIEIGAQAPSACNRQPFVFRVFDDPELVQQVAALPGGTAGFAHNIPVIAVLIGQQRNYFDERDRHLIYIDGALCVMGVVYALEAQGLSSCCINWPDVESREAALARLLGLDPDERAVMCLAIGYPDPKGLVACSQKKPLDRLRRYNDE